MIGSIRRECLDHLVVLNERKLRGILSEYIAYYNKVHPHQSPDGNPPERREVEPPVTGKTISCRYESCVAKTKGRCSTSSDPFPKMAPHTGQSSQLFVDGNNGNAEFLPNRLIH